MHALQFGLSQPQASHWVHRLLPALQQEPEAQRAQYSGKKKAHTDKNLLVVSEATGRVAYLEPTEAGSRHDKRAADEAGIAHPACATLGQDTGFQGYAPEAIPTEQPKKSRRAGS